ncbi:MAG: hypothetical protein ACL7BU_15205 [Candidatus Phlomobacter fragariae]
MLSDNTSHINKTESIREKITKQASQTELDEEIDKSSLQYKYSEIVSESYNEDKKIS